MMAEKLTSYQSKIIGILQRAPNTHADWYQVAWNDTDLIAEWRIPRKRGILITNTQKAAKKLEALQLIFILPPPHRKRCRNILPTA